MLFAGNCYRPAWWGHRCIVKTLLVMKLTAVLLIAGLIQVSAKGYSQNVSLSGANLQLKEVFERAEKQTGYYFLFKVDDLKDLKPVSFSVTDMPVKDFLETILAGQPLHYTLRQNSIVISRKTHAAFALLVTPVKGVVRNASGKPLAGASVLIKGTRRGTITDENGVFRIDAEQGEVLYISFTGYSHSEIKITNDASLNIMLIAKESELDGITINGGYYKTTDRTKTGSISKVSSREIERQPVTSPLMALQGRVPGLEVVPNNGIPGSALKVQIRGRNSLRGDGIYEQGGSSPLYVVDGVQVSSAPIRSASNYEALLLRGYDPLATISPSNIESIEVLKDADATAIYGSRGANGVILITTKQGSAATKTKIDVNAYTGGGKIVGTVDLLNREQYLMMRREAIANDNVALRANDYDLNGAWDTTGDTDWQQALLGGTAQTTDLQVGVSGGNTNNSFRISAGYHRETTIYGSGFGAKLFSGSINVNHLSPNKKFRIGITANYGSNMNKTFEDFQVISDIVNLPPTAPKLRHEDGSLNWQIIESGGVRTNTFNNPLARMLNTNEMSGGNLIVSTNLGYNFGSGFSLGATLGYADMNADEVIKRPVSAWSPTTRSAGSTSDAKFSNNLRKNWSIDPQLNYNKKFNDVSVDLILGGTIQQSDNRFRSVGGTGYASDILLSSLAGATSSYILADLTTQSRYVSLLFRGTVNWKDKYILAATARRDGSSRFGPGKRFGNFGSVAGAWLFTNENIFKGNSSFLSSGKIRASYGVAGNDQIGDYLFLNSYSLSEYHYQGGAGMNPMALYNPFFSWESTRKMDLALELGFLQNRIFAELNWYGNRSSNQLIYYQLPITTGFDNIFRNSPATVENTGMEAIVRADIIRARHFNWNISFNISRNWNKLIAFPNLETSTYATQYIIGEPITLRNLYTYKGVNPQTGLYEVEDLNNDGLYNFDDQRLLMPLIQKYYGGLTNSVGYKGILLEFTLQYSNQEKLPYVPNNPPGYRNFNMPVEVLDRWRKPGDIAAYQKFSQTSGAGTTLRRYNSSTGNIQDASFIRLKTLSLTYSLPQDFLSRLSMSQMRIYVQGQNLLTFTKFRAFDPETVMSLPPLRFLTAGISATF